MRITAKISEGTLCLCDCRAVFGWAKESRIASRIEVIPSRAETDGDDDDR